MLDGPLRSLRTLPLLYRGWREAQTGGARPGSSTLRNACSPPCSPPSFSMAALSQLSCLLANTPTGLLAVAGPGISESLQGLQTKLHWVETGPLRRVLYHVDLVRSRPTLQNPQLYPQHRKELHPSAPLTLVALGRAEGSTQPNPSRSHPRCQQRRMGATGVDQYGDKVSRRKEER